MIFLTQKWLSRWCQYLGLGFVHLFSELIEWCSFFSLWWCPFFLQIAYICEFRSVLRYVPCCIWGTCFSGGVYLSHQNVFLPIKKDWFQGIHRVDWKTPPVPALFLSVLPVCNPRMRTSKAVMKKPWEQKQKTRFSQRQRPSAALIKACFALWGSLIAKMFSIGES